MINEQIRDKEVRLIGANGEQLGIMSARDAMKIARASIIAQPAGSVNCFLINSSAKPQ